MRASILILLALFTFSGFAQVNLTTSPYTENFDNLGSAGIPTGFTVKKLATPIFLGTDTILNPGVTPPWRGVGRGYKNFASSTQVTDPGADSTTQAASTNRALGVRQTSAFADSGAAFVFQIANTTGKENFKLNFLLQSLDTSSPRTTTWIVDYGIGANPTTFTPVSTSPAVLTTGNKLFLNTAVTADFGTALNNISDIVWVRVVTVKRSIGSGNRPSTAIDDWSLTWNSTASSTNDLISGNNPVSVFSSSSVTTVQFEKAFTNTVNLSLTSANGQVVYLKSINQARAGQTEIINLEALPAGMYILSVSGSGIKYARKIIR
jgi:hypothetical protein